MARKFRALRSGRSYLAKLRYFELLTLELPGRLDALCQALMPRYAQKALPAGAGGWSELEQATSRLATVPVVAALYRELVPDAAKLAALIEKLVHSNPSWPTDLELQMTNAATAVHDFAEEDSRKDHVKKLEAQFARERALASSGAVEDRTAVLELELRQARSVLAGLGG